MSREAHSVQPPLVQDGNEPPLVQEGSLVNTGTIIPITNILSNSDLVHKALNRPTASIFTVSDAPNLHGMEMGEAGFASQIIEKIPEGSTDKEIEVIEPSFARHTGQDDLALLSPRLVPTGLFSDSKVAKSQNRQELETLI